MINWSDTATWEKTVSDSVVDAHEEVFIGEGALIMERVVISPARGRFYNSSPQHYTSEGEYVLEGQVVGSIRSSNGEEVPVKTKFSGWVMNVFVQDGWPVGSSEAILSLRPL
jgi:biotin carboxyl carrier protein